MVIELKHSSAKKQAEMQFCFVHYILLFDLFQESLFTHEHFNFLIFPRRGSQRKLDFEKTHFGPAHYMYRNNNYAK